MIGISWNNFDKAFWVSSTNMRNIINSAINIDINVGHVESDLNNAYDLIFKEMGDTSKIMDEIMDIWEEFADVYRILDEIMDLISGGGGGGGDPSDPELAARVSILESKVNNQQRQIEDIITTVDGMATTQQRFMQAQQELNLQLASEIVQLDERIKALGG